MADADDDAARSTTDPDGAPQVETEDAEPGVWPAVKGERDVGPHDDTDDAIDKAKRDVDAEAEEAARRSGYADRGESEDAASDR